MKQTYKRKNVPLDEGFEEVSARGSTGRIKEAMAAFLGG